MDSKERLENVKRRIKKLLALSKSPNENEALAALDKARTLMDAYNLTEAEIMYTRHTVKTTKRISRWRVILADAVAWLNYCEFFNIQGAGEMFFFGEEFDAFLAGEMYGYLSKAINRMVKQNINKKTTRKGREDYRIGITCKLHDRIHTLGSEASWASQREKKLLAIRKIVNETLSVTNSKLTMARGNGALFWKGVTDGNGIPLNRQTTGSGGRVIGSGDI